MEFSWSNRVSETGVNLHRVDPVSGPCLVEQNLESECELTALPHPYLAFRSAGERVLSKRIGNGQAVVPVVKPGLPKVWHDQA